MRLTLRNLLRFLDQADLRSVERKRLQELVDQSEKASNWIQRIEALRADTGIGALGLHEEGDFDLNTVAAYLDMTMGEAQISEFERDLLANDPLMAEVAACHQLKFQLASDEPTHISLELRQSIYDLNRNGENDIDHAGESIEGIVSTMEDLPFEDASPDKQSIARGGGIADESLVDHEDEPEIVPIERLSRQARSRSLLNTCLLLIILAGLVGLAFWMGRQSVTTPATDKATQDSDGQAAKIGAEPAGSDSSAASAKPGTSPAGKQSTEAPTSEEPGTEAPPLVFTDQPQPELNQADAPENKQGELPLRPSIALDDKSNAAPPGGDPASDEPAVEVARLVEPNALLAIRRVGGQWMRATPETPILSDGEVLALIGQTARIAVGNSHEIVLMGPARATLSKAKNNELVTINLDYGQALISAREIETKLIVGFGEQSGELAIPVVNGLVSLERVFYSPPGIDPRSQPPLEYDLLNWIALKGSWSFDGQTTSMSEQSAWSRVGDASVQFGNLMNESALEQLQPLTQFAEDEFAELFLPTVDLVSQLTSLTQDNRKEFRAAAICALASMNQYEYLVDFLNDERNRTYWPNVIGAVRFYLANQAGAVDRLYADLEQAGSRQDNLFQLLLGTSQDQLVAGRDAELVELLNDSELAMRVLAIDNLRTITDGLTYSYRPEAPGRTRRRHVNNWRSRKLDKQAIRYSQPPQPPVVSLGARLDPGVENPADPDK